METRDIKFYPNEPKTAREIADLRARLDGIEWRLRGRLHRRALVERRNAEQK